MRFVRCSQVKVGNAWDGGPSLGFMLPAAGLGTRVVGRELNHTHLHCGVCEACGQPNVDKFVLLILNDTIAGGSGTDTV